MTRRTSTATINSLRLIVMSLGELTLACRIESVYKVVNHSQVYSSGLGYTGVTHIDDHAVVVIDLHHKLFKIPTANQNGYFVILKPRVGDLLAIPVTTSPNLMDIQRDHIRVLPESYRQTDTLSIASHVAVVPHKDETLTIFVIDENTLI